MNYYFAQQKAVDELYSRFKQHGVPKQVISDVISLGLKAGLGLEQSVVGARLALSKHYDFQEYFSEEDIMTATGSTRQGVYEAMQKAEKEITARGENVSDYFMKVTVAPHGIQN